MKNIFERESHNLYFHTLCALTGGLYFSQIKTVRNKTSVLHDSFQRNSFSSSNIFFASLRITTFNAEMCLKDKECPFYRVDREIRKGQPPPLPPPNKRVLRCTLRPDETNFHLRNFDEIERRKY